jgi:membrane protein
VKQVINLNKIKNFIKELYEVLLRPEMLFLPGQLAFSLVCSLIPAISLALAFSTRFHLSLNFMTEFINSAFSVEAADYLVSFISTGTITISSIFITIIALSIASNGFSAVIVSADSMYGLKPTHPIKRRIKALFLTLLFMFLLLFILLVPVFGGFIMDAIAYLSNNAKIAEIISYIYELLKWPLSLLLIVFFVKLNYTLAPDKVIPSKFINKGAIFTTIMFSVVTLSYSFYVNNMARYDLYYGNFANIIILMLWLYFMSYIFVTGLALNQKDYKRYSEKKE